MRPNSPLDRKLNLSDLSVSILRLYWRQRDLQIAAWDAFPAVLGRRNLSVAIVGNAGYLSEGCAGSQIDACDVVIRMNNCRVAGFERQVGSRTDVFMTNFSPYTMDFSNPVIASASHLVSSRPNNFCIRRQQGLRHRMAKHLTDGMREIKRRCAFAPAPDYFADWTQRVGAYPTTGMMAVLFVLDALNDCVQSVFITGFSFFQGRSHYFSDAHVDAEQFHNLSRERLLLQPWLQDPRVQMDPTMRECVRAV